MKALLYKESKSTSSLVKDLEVIIELLFKTYPCHYVGLKFEGFESNTNHKKRYSV